MTYEPQRFDFSIPVRVNMYSDTQTKPSRGMKQAMLEADVGDEQAGSDPSVWALCDRVAALLGKEAAVFLPSGTMCNQVAIATHCRPGDEILAHESAHIITSEAGAPGAIAGVTIKGLPGERGQFTAETLEAAIRPRNRNVPSQTLVEVEQTANRGGGACWSVEGLRAVMQVAHKHGIATHMDGARVLNAAVALGVNATELTEGCDTVWLDFTKGLAEDHANAKALARGMAQIPGIEVEHPETNLVFFDTKGTGMTAADFAGKLRRQGVLVSTSDRYRARACLHLDVTAADVEEALSVMRQAVNG